MHEFLLPNPNAGVITPWTAASGHRGKRQWWISRYLDGYGVTGDYAKSANGRIRTFTSYESAKRVADKLNNESKGTL